MADLDDMLLEAAGRMSASGRKKLSHAHSAKHLESSCSDLSDSKKDESRVFEGKHSGSHHVRLKKKFETLKNSDRTNWIEDDQDKLNSDDSDGAPSVGSDLYKDDKDREVLAKMTELDREMILAERSVKIDDYRLKKKARESSLKADYSMIQSPPPLSSRSRLSVRSEKVSAKSNVLNALRAKRMGLRGQISYSKVSDLSGTTTGFVDDVDGSSDSDTGFSTNEKESPNCNNILIPFSEHLNFEDIKEITIQRSRLARWFMESFFDDVIVGCFVRVGVAKTPTASKYRLCLVKSVDLSSSNQQYKLEGRSTRKWLNCAWASGESLTFRCQMAMISDSPPLENEFMEWESKGNHMLNYQDVKQKKIMIQEISNLVYSAETVKQILEKKRLTLTKPLNVAAEKDRLRKEIEAAESRGDDFNAKWLQTKLKDLVESSKHSKQFDEKAAKLAEINRKNKAENFRIASEKKPVNTCLKAGEEGYDPFSRRWTRSRNYFLSKSGGVNAEDASAMGSSLQVNAMAIASPEGGPGAGKLVGAPVDNQGIELNSPHHFDLPISLAGLQSFGSPHGAGLAFMARKQKIEATIGSKVPENDGKLHLSTLSVSEYMRRRGLSD